MLGFVRPLLFIRFHFRVMKCQEIVGKSRSGKQHSYSSCLAHKPELVIVALEFGVSSSVWLVSPSSSVAGVE